MALYNKYRPASLKMVCGQEHVKRILASQVRQNDLVHAYLFTGPAGTGKTTVARILAAMINCSTGMTVDIPADDPFVSAIMSGRKGMDVYEMDAASTRGIDDAKELRSIVFLPPMEMRKRVFIIDECHQLTPEAWAVLLKMIEEPPPYSVFILCTTELNKVLETIQTRCQCFSFRQLNVEDIFPYIKNIAIAEGIQADDEALRLISIGARGSLRDALSKLDKARHAGARITPETVSELVGVPSRKIIRRYVAAIVSAKIADGIAASSEALGIGVSPQDFLCEVANVCHDLLLHGRSGVDAARYGYTPDEASALEELRRGIFTAINPGHEDDPLTRRLFRQLISQWIKVVQESSKLTVYNLQPQFQANIAFVEMFNAFTSNIAPK
jgi:DNA polymerase-3 subunit gamma/tau